ncbi:hypothetical protein [Novosphingobium beihaiensis]|uniref:TniQ protein n=1 Tax=Novosphingobium beihaiensis TaxID=2930389 RepID=A0ABT0BQI8_9SPHN|nr:hypothetical protein [Novosphingobium beihaiensis]MCJ2187066.1 hypothetical protein [Novosphingobium beihaiensis]
MAQLHFKTGDIFGNDDTLGNSAIADVGSEMNRGKMVRDELIAVLGDSMALREIAGYTLADILAAAVEAGKIEWTSEGRLGLPTGGEQDGTAEINSLGAENPRHHYYPCSFLNLFLFREVYRQSLIPFGCRNCYKVKVEASCVAELAAIREIAPAMPCPSKCACTLNYPYSVGVWSAFFYVDGLAMAFDVHRRLQAAIADHPRLANAELDVSVKRGCSLYEARLGPSDRWVIDETLEPLERRLHSLFEPPREHEGDNLATFMGWIVSAHSIGDESYLELTRGKPIRPPTVDYLKVESRLGRVPTNLE